jgi:site-specific DNA-methyltransferase (adenine-specific)
VSDVRLYLGDCLEVFKTLADGSVDAVVTDPPYGIGYQSARRTDIEARYRVLVGDDALSLDWVDELPRIMADPSCLFCFCRWDVQEAFRGAISLGLVVRSQVVWDRGVHGLGNLYAGYAPCHDVAWFATKGAYAFPGRRPKTIYRCDRVPACKLVHPTQKPAALMRWIVDDLAPEGATVFDPFMGSGTTGVACVQTGRNFIGIEIDPGYYAIAERRIAEAQQQLRLPMAAQ